MDNVYTLIRMDVTYELHSQSFEWDSEKASANLRKHHVSFERACEVFFDPLLRLVDASSRGEERDAVIGLAETGVFSSSCTSSMKQTLFASSPPAGPQLRRGGSMSMNERIQKRLRKDRPMTTISIRLPEDVIEDLKLLAPEMGFSGYQPLIRAYIGQGLRKDLARLVENDQVKMRTVVESLRRHGVDEQVIAEAIAEAKARTA
jgi:uncharacterized DUF497 family protein